MTTERIQSPAIEHEGVPVTACIIETFDYLKATPTCQIVIAAIAKADGVDLLDCSRIVLAGDSRWYWLFDSPRRVADDGESVAYSVRWIRPT